MKLKHIITAAKLSLASLLGETEHPHSYYHISYTVSLYGVYCASDNLTAMVERTDIYASVTDGKVMYRRGRYVIEKMGAQHYYNEPFRVANPGLDITARYESIVPGRLKKWWVTWFEERKEDLEE